jgi:tetratricopeptide (TPR) repeat protein/DNA polymerase III delta prime subunit
MPVSQHSPAPTVSWPVQSGPVPPLSAFYSARPETGFGAISGQSAEQLTPLIRAEETGSYVLTGPSGTGKTQLAAAYARSLWRARDIELLVWIAGSSRAAILTGYAQACYDTSKAAGGPALLAGPPGAPAGATGGMTHHGATHHGATHHGATHHGATLNGSGLNGGGGLAVAESYGSGEDQEEIGQRFLRWLAESTRSWLVVIDDLAEADDLADLWPRGAMGRTVLTTRLLPASISPPGQHAKLVQVGPFSRREALSYLTARLYEDTAQRNGALDLAQTLGCLPIALAQAGALIADCRIECRDYRSQFTERRQAMGIGPDSGHAATVAVTWSLALDRTDQLLPSALARPILAMLSMLNPDGIPAAALTSKAAREYIGSYSADRAPASDQQVRGVLSTLAQVGLVTIDPASAVRTVYVHSLVQACVRQVLPPAVRNQAALAGVGAVLEAWPDYSPDPHLDQALRDSAATLMAAAPEVMWSAEGHPLLLRAGQSLDAARLSGPAIAYWRALAEASGQAPDSEGGDQALEYLQLLAAAYEAADRIDLAIDVLNDSLAQREESAGPGHPETLTARGQLARMCLAAGRMGEALPLFERTLAGREWVLGPDHPDTLGSRSDLAAAYRSAGRIEDAITVYRRTLTAQELILGEDHPTTVATRGSLAAALHSAGRIKDAIPLYVQTLADRERVLGPDNPDTLTARGNLAYAYRSIGKLKDAIPLYSRTLTDRERVLGPDHLDTITARANLAAAYYSARKLKEAIPLYERTLADRERVEGPDHPDTLTARGNLASAYHSAGRLVVATEQYEAALAAYERVLGPHHENTLTSRANLALAYHSARRMTDAVALLRRTLADCEQALPPDHPLTQSVRESLDAASRS